MLTVTLGQMFLPGFRNEDGPRQEAQTSVECVWVAGSDSSKESQGKEEGIIPERPETAVVQPSSLNHSKTFSLTKL